MGGLLRQIFFKDLGLKLIALICAAILWFWVDEKLFEERTITVSLSATDFIVPEDRDVQLQDVKTLDVTVRATRGSVLSLTERDLRICVDLGENATDGLIQVPLSERDLTVPEGMSVVKISPERVTVRVARTYSRRLKVRVIPTGRPAEGYFVAGYNATPDHVTIRGPREVIDKLTSIDTLPIEIGNDVTSDVTVSGLEIVDTVVVDGSSEPVPVSCLEAVIATVVINKQPARLRIPDVPIKVLFGPGARLLVGLDPEQAHIEVEGRETSVAGLSRDPDRIKLFVDVSGKGSGEYDLAVEVILSKGVTLVRCSPARVKVILTEPQPEPQRAAPIKPEALEPSPEPAGSDASVPKAESEAAGPAGGKPQVAPEAARAAPAPQTEGQAGTQAASTPSAQAPAAGDE